MVKSKLTTEDAILETVQFHLDEFGQPMWFTFVDLGETVYHKELPNGLVEVRVTPGVHEKEVQRRFNIMRKAWQKAKDDAEEKELKEDKRKFYVDENDYFVEIDERRLDEHGE